MKYSMESQVPCDSFCSHIPHQWLHNVTEASLSTVDEDAFTSEPVGMNINHQRAELMNQIHYLKSYFSVESGKLTLLLQKICLDYQKYVTHLFLPLHFVKRFVGTERYFEHTLSTTTMYTPCSNSKAGT
jgi:hypothetical protein